MKYFYALLISTILFSCNTVVEKSKIDTDREKLTEMEAKLMSDSTMQIDKELAKSTMVEYANFAENYPEDSLAAEYFFKAAELAQALQIGTQAVLYYDLIIEKYPNYKRISYSYFLKGFVYENVLADMDNAKIAYTEFLEKYPNHEFADDAKVLIDNLGKSPEELIKMFEEQNKEQN